MTRQFRNEHVFPAMTRQNTVSIIAINHHSLIMTPRKAQYTPPTPTRLNCIVLHSVDIGGVY